jgi:ribosome-associated translation inhibitor RaiA
MEPDLSKEDAVTLGGNIELIGFRDLDPANLIVLKKIVGNSVRHFSERLPRFERFTLAMKRVHEREHSEIYEIHARLRHEGKLTVASMEDRNLFFAVDKCIKRLETEVFGR